MIIFRLNFILGFNDEQNELNTSIKNAAHKLTVKLEKIKDQINKNKESMTTEHRIKKSMVRIWIMIIWIMIIWINFHNETILRNLLIT